MLLASIIFSGVELIVVNKVEGFLLRDTVDMRDLVPEFDTVKLVGVFQQLRPKEEDNLC